MQMMDAANAQIEWNDDDQHRVTELVVFDRTAISPQDWEAHRRRYQASWGACNAGWMTDGYARSTPEGFMATLFRRGFADDDAMLNALDQFGQIKEAAWARTMAAALRSLFIQEGGAEDDVKERYAPALYEPTQ